MPTNKNEEIKNTFQEFLKTDNFRVCTVSFIRNVAKFIEESFNKADNLTSIGYMPPEIELAVEQKYISQNEDYYCVIAFVKWDSEKKKAIIKPVENRLKKARNNVNNREELKEVIASAKKIQAELNVKQIDI